MALTDGLVGYWSPWLGSSGYRLLDRARSNHGTLTNMDAGTDWVGATIQGRSGFALDFDGSNDFISIPTVGFPTIPGAKTVSIWTQWDGTTGRRIIFSLVLNDTSTANNSWSVEFNSSTASIVQWGGASVASCSLSGFSSNAYLNIVAVYESGGTNRVFINASQGATTGTHTGNGSTGVCRIASFNSAFPGPYHNRPIAETVLWNRGLLPTEIRELYRLGPGWYRPYAKRSIGYAIAGFKAYWHRRQSQVIGGGLR